ncbi:MAG: PD40 domain-containing protein, partial [Deltaproteobacteria bacterium]|nr:PD40 domain-containing protein [Deltaproteobacteria bacterium]
FKELFIVDLDGSNLRQLTHDRGIAMSPSWSPRGDSIAYMSFRSRRPQIYLISPGGGTPRQVTNHTESVGAPEFSADGQIYASASYNGFSNIVGIDPQTRAMRKLTSGSTIDTSPTVSPDGSRIAFTSNRGGGPQIYTMSSSGGGVARLSFTGSNYCTSPSWSPKGDQIAFSCLSGGNQIFLSSSAGGKAEQLTFGGNNEDPGWSPDGRFIIFSSSGGRGRSIAIIPVQTGVAKPLAFARGQDSQPVWSPRMQ